MYRKIILMVVPACVTSIGIGLLSTGCDMSPPPSCMSSGDCDDGDSCTVDICDAGICNNTPGCTTNVQCNDGNLCTSDVCLSGCCSNAPLCVTDSSCNDGDPSTTDTCRNGCCQNKLDPELAECETDAGCDDANPCNGTETCVGGDCRAGSPVNCDDGDPCTIEACVVENGEAICDASKIQCPPGFVCVNGLCVRSAMCVSGLDCDDGDLCTVDACVNGDCSYTAVDCDDGLFCNGTESCDSATGACVSSGDPCGAGETCDEANDVCVVETGELHGMNASQVTIPGSGNNECPNPQGAGELIIELSGAPSGSVVSKVKVVYEIDHTCLPDVRVRVWALTESGNQRGAILRDQGTCVCGIPQCPMCDPSCSCCTSGIVSATADNLQDMNGLTPNQDWHLSVDDCWTGDNDGNTLNKFEIWVEYSSP